jgi:hypothetical protein
VQPVHGAIDYDHDGSAVPFSVAAVNFAGRVSGDSSGNGASEELAIIFVPRFKLSELLQEYGISEYVLVADIEGSEAGILLRDPRSLRMCRQAIIELHDTHIGGGRIKLQELVGAFIDLGFAVRARRGPVYCFERPGETL